MKFESINKHNIKTLYKLNKKLAICEKQKSLFSASFKEYKKLFLEKNSCANAFLVYKKDKALGFFIYNEKVATYLGAKVLYVEDMFLLPKYQKTKYINKLFDFIKKFGKKQKYKRIELRVLYNYNIGKKYIKKHGFKKIKKWSVYRLGT